MKPEMLLDIQGDMSAIKNTMNELEKLSDEEKAEEYANNCCGLFKELHWQDVKWAVLYGLAEGRKGENENIKKIQEFRKIDQEQILEQMDKISKLEKENEEQKEQIGELQLNLRSRNDLVEELTIQIEKMKNVGNCKKAMICAEWNEKQTILGCMKFCKNCKDWELSE